MKDRLLRTTHIIRITLHNSIIMDHSRIMILMGSHIFLNNLFRGSLNLTSYKFKSPKYQIIKTFLLENPETALTS